MRTLEAFNRAAPMEASADEAVGFSAHRRDLCGTWRDCDAGVGSRRRRSARD